MTCSRPRILVIVRYVTFATMLQSIAFSSSCVLTRLQAVRDEVIADLVDRCRSNQRKLMPMLTTTKLVQFQ